jgi:hypothetical protein
LARILLKHGPDFNQEEIVMTQKDLARGAGQAFAHLAAIVAGLILMVVCWAMGVSVVTLPIAVAGIFFLLWGMFGRESVAKPEKSIFDD